MPSTIKKLLEAVKLDPFEIKTVKWGQPLDEISSGIYFISTSISIESSGGTFDSAPIDDKKLDFWINKVNTIEIDNISIAYSYQLKERLNKFWHHDENILYIGQTDCKGGLKRRVNQYYNTEIGERKPHAGGHWIKTLSNLNDLYVHYIPSHRALGLEIEMLKCFIENVSSIALQCHGDPLLPLPFANLEVNKSNRKRHGISKSKLMR